MEPGYKTIEELLEMVDEPNRSACRSILKDNRKLFQTVRGSTDNHQAWLGGYFDHVQEIMNIVVVLFHRLDSIRSLPFSLSDVLLVVFLHDIEKPWKYQMREDGQLEFVPTLRKKDDQHTFRAKKLLEYGIVLTPEQQNGMRYVEGEFEDYTNRRRVMGPLAALCHAADIISARIWFDHPQAEGDAWEGAKRIRE
jgi:hypothetical protein